MRKSQTREKSLRKKRALTLAVVAAMALLAFLMDPLLRPIKRTTPTTSPSEIQARIKELVAEGYEEEITNSIGMKFRLVPPGTFIMGERKTVKMAFTFQKNREGPPHEVTITEPFYLGVTEVTQEQYKKIMGYNPNRGYRKNNPVHAVTWNDADAFCAKLSKIEKTTYSLPTEAQWEYACRAGTETNFYWGDDLDARYAVLRNNSMGDPRDVGMFKPNTLGLYDMSGNVWEYCSDWNNNYSAEPQKDPRGPVTGPIVYPMDKVLGPRRVTRGGSWRCGIGYRYYSMAGWSAGRASSRPDKVRSVGGYGFRVLTVRPRN